MTDTQFRTLSWEQYQTIIQHGSFPNVPEPMLTRPDYDSLIAVMQTADMDPRWPLAFTWAEGHDGTDPGLVAASVNNLGGIKFVGQSGATDSGIPADTGGTYAAFPDLTGYWQEFVRIMHNAIIGPFYAAGDLVSVVEHYTNGPGTGHNKIDQYNAYLRDYPPEGATTVVTGTEIIAKARTYIGQSNSDGIDGNTPPNHPWAYWCEAFAECIPRSFGLDEARVDSAVDDGHSHPLVTSGQPENGAWVFFDERFYAPSGHVGFWDAEKGMLLSTLTDGTGVGYRAWGPQTVGYMGWILPPGVTADSVVSDPPLAEEVNGHVVGGGIEALYHGTPDRLRVFGLPTTDEYAGYLIVAAPAPLNAKAIPVTIQDFQRDQIIYDLSTPDPFRTRVPLRSEHAGAPDDALVIAVLHAMELAKTT